MRRHVVFAAVIAAAAAAIGCESTSYPASPVPARMTDREAVFQARNYLAEKTAPPVMLVGIEPTEQGKMLHYKTLFQSAATPPREHRIVNVHNDGTVSEALFRNRD